MVRVFYVKYTKMLSFFLVTDRDPYGPDLPSLSGRKFQFSVQFGSPLNSITQIMVQCKELVSTLTLQNAKSFWWQRPNGLIHLHPRV